MFKNKMTFLLVPILSMFTLHASDPFFNDPFGDDIFKEMYEMQQQMDKVFERMNKQMQERTQRLNQPNTQFYMPSINNRSGTMFTDNGSYYEYNTGVAANKENEINLSVKDGIVTFKAKVVTTTSTQKPNIQSKQSFVSVIQRSQTLPTDADAGTIKMEEQGGIIMVTVQKKKEDKNIEKKPESQQKPLDKTKPSLMPSHKSEDKKKKEIIKVPHSVTEA